VLYFLLADLLNGGSGATGQGCLDICIDLPPFVAILAFPLWIVHNLIFNIDIKEIDNSILLSCSLIYHFVIISLLYFIPGYFKNRKLKNHV
jgi:hypothetical protein